MTGEGRRAWKRKRRCGGREGGPPPSTRSGRSSRRPPWIRKGRDKGRKIDEKWVVSQNATQDL